MLSRQLEFNSVPGNSFGAVRMSRLTYESAFDKAAVFNTFTDQPESLYVKATLIQDSGVWLRDKKTCEDMLSKLSNYCHAYLL